MRVLGLLLAVCGFVLAGLPVADAQSQSGRGIFNDRNSQVVENACRTRINDLRIGIQALTKDIEDIRACSAAGGFPMRSGNNVLCRPAVLGHHQLVDSNLAVQFFTNGGWGTKGNMKGNPGDPGRDVRCDQCTGTWVDPPPSCPPGFSGNYQANQVCDNGLCCGSGGSVSICCSNGAPCVSCDDWTVEYAHCSTLDRNVVSGGSCPSGNCCGAPPEAETCPGECTEGYWTYDYTDWSTCQDNQQTRSCERCDGQPADCSQCGGICTQPCTQQCTSYTWHASGGWSTCSGDSSNDVSCGSGQQTRAGTCRCDQTGEAVSDTLCNLADRQRSCSYSFAYTDWGTCSGSQKSRTCRRCDGQSADCSACGGQCTSSEGCGPPASCDGPLVPLTADDPEIKINFIGLCFYPHRNDWQTYYGFTFPHSGEAPSCTSYSGGPIPSTMDEGTGWNNTPGGQCPGCVNMNKFTITALGETKTFYSLSPLGTGQFSFTVNGRTVVMDKVLAYYSGPGMVNRVGAQIRISNIRRKSCQ